MWGDNTSQGLVNSIAIAPYFRACPYRDYHDGCKNMPVTLNESFTLDQLFKATANPFHGMQNKAADQGDGLAIVAVKDRVINLKVALTKNNYAQIGILAYEGGQHLQAGNDEKIGKEIVSNIQNLTFFNGRTDIQQRYFKKYIYIGNQLKKSGEQASQQSIELAMGKFRNFELRSLIESANRDIRMYCIYKDLLTYWFDNAKLGTFGSFTLPQNYHPWGSFGIQEYIGQDINSSPKYAALLEMLGKNLPQDWTSPTCN